MPGRTACLLCAVTTALQAQAPNTADVKRNNEPWYYTAAAVHPGTGREYNLPLYQPPGYWSALPTDPGVAAGALSWRWIPSRVNLRREPRQVSGCYVWLRASAPTVTFPFTGYVPEWKVHPVRARGGVPQNGYEPDLGQPPHVIVPEASFVFASPGAVRARTAFSAPVAVTAEEVCFSHRWRGGEHRLKPGSQGFVGTSQEAPWRVPTWGHADPQSAITVVDPIAQVGQYTTLWGSYYETAPVIVVESDFAHERQPPPAPPPYTGYNDAAGLCDLATLPLSIGWNVDGGLANAGNFVLPLCNARRTLPAGTTSVLGMTLEVDPLDPLFSVLVDAGYLGNCDAQGFFDGPRVPFPVLPPSAIGVLFGVEFAVVKADLTAFVGSTQAHWVEVIR
jgi:hypothetical protein